MKKLLCVVAGICLVSFVAGSAIAGQPSAKFVAVWGEDPALVSVADTSGYVITDTVLVDSHTGFTLATIKVPQGKELLVGVSAEIGLITNTSIKGKAGGAARAIADGEAYVTVFAVPTGEDVDVNSSVRAAPGEIMLSKRVQELDATLAGVLDSCTDTGDWAVITPEDPELLPYCEETRYAVCGDDIPLLPGEDGYNDAESCPDGDLTILCECSFTDEEIGLLQSTTAAHHFNFVFPNMNQGTYDIVAVFTTGARAQVDICDPGDECYGAAGGTVAAAAYAKAVINKYMLTVQQVRAAKDTLGVSEIIEIIE